MYSTTVRSALSVLALRRGKDTFERGQKDEFGVQCRTLGALRAIRIESDGRSGKPSWHLDMVVIIAPGGERFFFPYHNWLADGVLKVGRGV